MTKLSRAQNQVKKLGRASINSPLSVVAAAIFSALPVYAQAQVNQEQYLEIQVQPLAQALVEIGQDFSVDIIAPAQLTSGYQAPALNAKLTLEQALTQLLENTDLTTKACQFRCNYCH